MIFLFQGCILRFHVNLPRCIQYFMSNFCQNNPFTLIEFMLQAPEAIIESPMIQTKQHQDADQAKGLGHGNVLFSNCLCFGKNAPKNTCFILLTWGNQVMQFDLCSIFFSTACWEGSPPRNGQQNTGSEPHQTNRFESQILCRTACGGFYPLFMCGRIVRGMYI